MILQHLPFVHHFCFVAGHVILLKDATALREYHFHEMVYMVCNKAKVGDVVK